MDQQLTIYNAIEAGLDELKRRHQNVVVDVSTSKGMSDARTSRAEVRQVRLNIEQARKEGKAESLEYGRRVDAEAKRLTAEIIPLEEQYDLPIKAGEQRKEEEKQAKLEAERQRIAAITEEIFSYRNSVLTHQGKTAIELEEVLKRMRATKPEPEFFAEFQSDAEHALQAAIDGVQRLYETRVQFDEQQAQLKAQQEAFALQQAEAARVAEIAAKAAAEEQERERVRFQAEQVEAAKTYKAARDAEEAEAKAKRDSEAAALKKQREAVEEKERLVNEAIKKQAAEDEQRRKLEAERLKRLYDNAALMLEALKEIKVTTSVSLDGCEFEDLERDIKYVKEIAIKAITQATGE